MKNTEKQKIEIKSQNLDAAENASVESIMQFLQDVANSHCEKLGADRWSLLKNSGAFWVTTKVKLQINRLPKLDEKLTFETWTITPSAVKFERDAKISKGKNSLVKIKSEWVALDATTHKIRAAKSLSYPLSMKNRTDRAIEGKFLPLDYQTEQKDFCYSRVIKVGDLDANNHVNNCYYSRFVFDCFSLEEYKKLDVDTYEIHFANECHEGDKLDFFRKQVDAGIFVEAKVGEKQIIKALITQKQ